MEYELDGVTSENIGNVETTCGNLTLSNINKATIIVIDDLCAYYTCSPCVISLFGYNYSVSSENRDSIAQYRSPPFQHSSYEQSLGQKITPIELPPISDYIVFWPENCIYSFDPPLPVGLELIDDNIVGTPLISTTVSLTLSTIEVFSKISVQIGEYTFTIPEPVLPTSLSGGNIVAIIVGTILGTAVLVLIVFIIRQRQLARLPYDFTSLVAENAVELAPTNEDLKVPREISRSSIKCVELLGKGSFGEVYKGIYTEKGKPGFLVAVKSLINSMDKASDRLQFLSEASLMVQFDHENVIKIIGVVTSGDPLLLIIEFCEAASLERVLHSVKLAPQYQLKASMDCAKGMVYLTSLWYVHRDLAARNNFVSSDFTSKIGDFGLSRVNIDTDYYISRNATVSIRWSSPEALEERRFSEQSDVWSFGVLLYEIWTHGMLPYNGLTAKKVWSNVLKGIRLQQPDKCPDGIYKIMCDCWAEYLERPVFTQLLERLEALKQGIWQQSPGTATSQSNSSDVDEQQIEPVRDIIKPETSTPCVSPGNDQETAV